MANVTILLQGNTKYDRRKKMMNKAMDEAAQRDKEKGYYILKVSARRYAIVRDYGLSWTVVGDRLKPEGYQTEYSLGFAEDDNGKLLNSLSRTKANEWYKHFVFDEPTPAEEK